MDVAPFPGPRAAFGDEEMGGAGLGTGRLVSRLAPLQHELRNQSKLQYDRVRTGYKQSSIMGKVTIFTRDGCPFCAKAKELLSTKGVQFHEVSLSKTPEWRPLLFILAGGRQECTLHRSIDCSLSTCTRTWEVPRQSGNVIGDHAYNYP